MRIVNSLLCLLVFVGGVLANSYDLYFRKDAFRGLCVSENSSPFAKWRNADDTKNCITSLFNDVRIRVVNPVADLNKKFGFDIVRPFFILDGIYLSTDGMRTLEDFHKEAMQFGLTDLLSELGYTPILVQFAETVRKPLTWNASNFTDLLHFVNSNKFFGFSNSKEDGIIVLGISQGGILGRYGAYKYDIGRSENEAPIRMYGSLDSPHQGAVMPRGLFYTVNFWATSGGSSAAEAFADLIDGPGASELLLYSADMSKSRSNRIYDINTSADRFLFGEYRKAAEYDKFPAVLISQGQMKGSIPAHGTPYYRLDRTASKVGVTFGHAQSNITANDGGDKEFAHNRIYELGSTEDSKTEKGPAKMDFVQGSTYPFARTLYESFREGFLDAMPNNMKMEVSLPFGLTKNLHFDTSWEKDTLIQKNSTFIPTVSALDMNCSGDLAIRKDCAYSAKAADISFTNPGSKSSAKSAYAVDQTHPRYREPISGRHVELPEDGSTGKIDTVVLRGMQTDIWRVLCEVAKVDYDASRKMYRNQNLAGVFDPNVSCMDNSKIPDVIKMSGMKNVKKFAYARYDYKPDATERNSSVTFDVPAGWHKVATFDNGRSVGSDGAFVVEISTKNMKSNWLKAELLLLNSKSGASQIQLNEMNVPVDGKTHTIRWTLPFADEALTRYRWFRLVLNSDGGSVTVSNPRLEKSAGSVKKFPSIGSKKIYPNATFVVNPWSESTTLTQYSDGLGSGLDVRFKTLGSGFYADFGSMVSLEPYTKLKVTYWPGTCQMTGVYFDSYKKGIVNLRGGVVDGNLVSRVIPLSDAVNTAAVPQGGLAASRLTFQSINSDERCIIHDVMFE